MKCRAVRRHLSAYLEGDLPSSEAHALAAHLTSCAGCVSQLRSLRCTLELVAELPRLEPGEGIAARVRDRLDLESRGPGLALLFRPRGASRPLMLPSLVPALLVLVTVLCGALAMDRGPRSPLTVSVLGPGDAWESRSAPWGSEANPLFPSTEVSVPRARGREAFPERLLAEMGEGTLFLETVVARDGSVSAVTLLDGDSAQAKPFLDILRRARFEPSRFRGRPVAVSFYRLISRMDVLAPVT